MRRIGSLCVLWLASLFILCDSLEVLAHPWRNMMTIAGRVISEETQLPIVAELLVTVEGFSPVSATTDATGSFSVMIQETARCQIVVNAEGFDGIEETVTISETASNYFEIRLIPEVKLTLDGTIYGGLENNNRPLDAKLTVYMNSDFVKEDSVAVISGKYSESFTNFGWYIFDFSAPGYSAARDTVWVMNTHRKNIHKDYHLVPLDSKLPIMLTNIHFKFGSSTIDPEHFAELDYISDFLNHNASRQIEIVGHTDNTGPVDYNLLLSQARVRSVINYLLSKGVSADRLLTKAYGDTKPIDSNTTAVGKANNRRVELLLSDPVQSGTKTN